MSGVKIVIDALPVLSYAAAHNTIPIVRTISLNSDVDAYGGRLLVTVSDDEGEIADPFEQIIDLVAGQTIEITAPNVRLNPSVLLQIKERRPAWIAAQFIADDTLGEAKAEVTVLAGAQWVAAPPGVAFELLAAYVLPNDPAISKVLVDATERLRISTGQSSLNGYQSQSREHVDAIVRSIWEAVQARAVRYSVPPASWADIGQKVRTPAEVLDGRLGTCLDTTLVMAAALEQAGIRPLLIVTAQHAFLGYWRSESTLDAVAYPGGHDIVNDVDLGHIGVVETTLLTERTQPAEFGEAIRAATTLIHQPDDVLAVVDVWQARQAKIVPIPVRRVDEDGTVQIIEYRAPGTGDRHLLIEPQGGSAEQQTASREVPPRVQQWKNSLLDLSLRNRLINYTKRAGVTLRVAPGTLSELENLVSAGHPISLRPDDQVEEVDRARGTRLARDLSADRLRAHLLDRQIVYADVLQSVYQTRMRGLANRARTIQEETGANNLYLALGSLVWEFDGRRLRSPLVLLPVRLRTLSRRTRYKIELDETGGSTPNFCLLEKLKQVHGMEIPGLAEPDEDEFGIDIDAALRATREAIAEKALPYHVEESADLSILQFAKFRLWKDLDENWDALANNSLVRHLIETPTDRYVDPVPAPEHIDLDHLDGVCPMPADASQLEAVAEAVAGRTFVLEGPPGTGKSQTITNLLARAVASGRRVLFVAQKRAALNVVAARLDTIGMGAFALDLHDKALRPNAVRSQIMKALDHTVLVDQEGLESNEEVLRSSQRTLARYAGRLHEPNPTGLSYYSARTRLLALDPNGPTIDLPRSLLTDRGLIDRIRQVMRDLPDIATIAGPEPDHPWGFVALTSLQPGTENAITAAVRAVNTAVDGIGSLPNELRHAALAARNINDFQTLSRLASYPIPLDALDEARSGNWRKRKEALLTAIAAFVDNPNSVLSTLSPEFLHLPVAEIHAEAQNAQNSGLFGRRKRLKMVAARLSEVALPNTEINYRSVVGLVAEAMQLRSAFESLVQQCNSVAGVTVPAEWNPLTPFGASNIQQQMRWVEWASTVVDPSTPSIFLDAVRLWLRTSPTVDTQVASTLDSLSEAFVQLASVAQTQASTWERWCGSDGIATRWLNSAERRDGDHDVVALRRWIELTALLEVLRQSRLGTVADSIALGTLNAEDVSRSFERGLANVSIDERAEATGLRSFDPEVHERAVRRFTSSLGDARSMMTSVLPKLVLSSRPFDASSDLGRMGELRRELARQRGGQGVRGLMAQYGDLIIQLMPMVLVSPDSIARFFPVGSQTFDLVVFDEASQIRVADAIGAMGRARSTVIVGDSKQMPPTSFGEPAAGSYDVDGGPSTAIEDEESILTEAVMARVPQRWLRWHYRSQDESLIAFSNAHYYDGKLASFPAPNRASFNPLAVGRGISFVRVDGKFLRDGKGAMLRTNPVEAEAIVAEVLRRFAESPDAVPSVGIVTFNQQQRDYIESLLRDSGDERCLAALESSDSSGLFVKNLENVQGDERDTILFSTAFSADDRGVLPLNFGPLTRAGGERRLNVAITRARRQVIIYSSFDPQDLRVNETSSVGIRHLRGYMEWAQGGGYEKHRANPLVDRHRDEIAARLRQRGLGVQTDVGLSEFRIDLTLAAPGQPDEPLVAVLLDGPTWADRRTVGDRDGLPSDVLNKLMGWPVVERVWLPKWLRDPEGTIDALVTATERALTEVATEPSAAPALSTSQQSFDPAAPKTRENVTQVDESEGEVVEVGLISGAIASGTPSPPSMVDQISTELRNEMGFQAFEPYARGGREVLDGLPSPSCALRVSRVVREVIDVEGPVHLKRLARLVAACFDLNRLSQARTISITKLVPPNLIQNDLDPGFAWPSTTEPLSWRTFRSSRGGSIRTPEEISLTEIANAMVELCVVSAGMEAAELDTEALLIFGGKRKTAGIQARLTAARGHAVRLGRLRIQEQLYVAVPVD